MSQSALSIRRRLSSVYSIRKITNAMKLIASSRLTRLKWLLDDAREYGSWMDRCLAACLESADFSRGSMPSCMRVGGGDRDLYVVVTSSLGLCGEYNAAVCRLLQGRLNESTDCAFIGEKGYRHLRDAVGESFTDFLHLSDRPSYSDVNSFRHRLDSLYLEKGYRAVYIAYTEPVNSMVTEPRIEKLLPVEPKVDRESLKPQIAFEPDPESVAELIVPHWLDSKIYRCLLSSAVSEQTCRRNSMDSATRSADDLIAKLGLEYNKARQQRITQEITEVISGAQN